MSNEGQVLTRTMLLEAVWDCHFDPQTNVIDVQISRLRSKVDRGFSPPLIHTIRGVGYLLGTSRLHGRALAAIMRLRPQELDRDAPRARQRRHARGHDPGDLAVFYFGTVGVLDRSIDGKIAPSRQRLITSYGSRPVSELAREINQELADGIDSDTEIFLVTSPRAARGRQSLAVAGRRGAARASDQPRCRARRPPVLGAADLNRSLPGGGYLYVGRDLSEQRSIRTLVLRALELAALISLVLVVVGAV